MKKTLKPFDVHYTFNGHPHKELVLAFSECHAVQVLIRSYEAYVKADPNCLSNFEAFYLPHIR